LEFWICALLQIGFGAEAYKLQFVVAVLAVVFMSCIVLFVAALFCWQGPWVKGFFVRWTLCKSLWQVRPTEPDFDADKFIEEHPRKPLEARFLSAMVNLTNRLTCRKCLPKHKETDGAKLL